MISSLVPTWLAQVTPRRGGREARAQLERPARAVLLLDGRRHVADPRRLHGLRGRRLAPQEPHVDGDEEHPHDRRRHPDLLLRRLVHLRLLRAGLPDDRARLARRTRGPGAVPGILRPDRAVGRRDGPEPPEPPERGLLPRLPPLLLDDGVDHVRSADRARPALRVPHPRLGPRLGRLDHGRGLGLELRRLADDPVRLPRLDRVAAWCTASPALHARRAPQPRAAHRQVHDGRPGPQLPRAQHPSDADGADAHLHRLLRLLRRVPLHHADGVPGLAQHLRLADDARRDRVRHHRRLRGRVHRRLVREQGRSVLDAVRRSRRRDLGVGRRRRLPPVARVPALDLGRDARRLGRATTSRRSSGSTTRSARSRCTASAASTASSSSASSPAATRRASTTSSPRWAAS